MTGEADGGVIIIVSILDQIIQRAEIVQITGTSYRFRYMKVYLIKNNIKKLIVSN